MGDVQDDEGTTSSYRSDTNIVECPVSPPVNLKVDASLPLALSMENQEFIIWLAGFFDGEGCFYSRYRGKRNGYDFRMIITQNNHNGSRVLPFVKDTLKMGNIFKKYRKSPREDGSQDYVIWKQADLMKVVTAMYPYLKVKKQEAANFLSKLHQRKISRSA